MFVRVSFLLRRANTSHFLPCKRKSSVRRLMPPVQLLQRINPLSGNMEWTAVEDEYDYAREIARSSYADMLHDTERNHMYYQAIKLAVKGIQSQGRKAKVLDIGTGTGLLSMMAATAGAEQITAIEVFAPMARVARQITKNNGFDFINVVNKHSTEVKLEPGGDMEEKANIIVTELFDTELIGEGALVAYHHAHQNLMEENCIAVPHSATTYVQLVESETMNAWHELNPITVDLNNGQRFVIEPDPSMKECPGVPAVHDIQLSQIRKDQFKELTSAVGVFKFNWGSRSLSPEPKKQMTKVYATATGKAQVVLSWWTLQMDVKGEIILSTAPYWCHPTPDNMQWRDHWIQSVYFLPQAIEVTEREDLTIHSHHDAYSMWFDVTHGKYTEVDSKDITHPVCNYLPRMLWSRPRLGMLNDVKRNESFISAVRKISFNANHRTVCASDVSILPLLTACFSNGKVYALESSEMAQKGIQNLVKHNEMSDRISVHDFETSEQESNLSIPERSINLLIAEPFYNCSLLPWHDLKFWYIRSNLDKYLSSDARIVPEKSSLCIVAVNFDDLWKIRAPVGNVEGFDVSVMDDMISSAMETEDYHEAEPHPLWEYPNTLLSSPQTAMTFDFSKCVQAETIHSQGFLELSKSSKSICHGVALWMEYALDEEISLSTGLINKSKINETAEWNMHYKQGVFFLRKPIDIAKSNSRKIEYKISFIPQTMDFNMKFMVNDMD